ncbi:MULTISPECIES: response regulator [unclassified Massilia]|uniref:response regulator n=1 Tax=unclassified Massilia TaxID=2609279 RepID=UPI001B82FF9E|nr:MULTISPECIES: response regulator [unclassified Massilia]MBQ5939375.1 response regulator [Massilia sp. AB1]MBQ5961455.1 response regulator [Massilia sp. ZL223]
MDKSSAILIVDDYLLIRTHVRQVLAELGFLNVFQADNGKTAQDVMRKQQIDIVVGDWGMPVMSGIDLLKWMRSDHRYAHTPFMMLTAEANPASVRTALQAGVNAYMIKPFTVHSFASKFMSMLGVTLDSAPASPFARPAPARPAVPSAPSPAPAPAAVAPAAPALPPSNVIGLDQPIGERVKKCTVLIVDDIPTNIEVLAGVLKDEYAIKVAISGKKALEIAEAFHVDLILLDIMMPVMDGFEVCRQLKANPKTAHIPIIFLSARDGTEDVVSGLRLGAVDYVAKPADPTILKARLSAHLMLATAMQDLKRQNELLIENARLREDVERMTRHDLKSPIAVALHGSQFLLGSALNEAQEQQARMIEEAAEHALEMINRTLDVYKMEQGTYQPILQMFDLGTLLAKVAQQVQLAFTEKDVVIRFDAPQDVMCLGEPMLCYSLFNNALKNAVEASPGGAAVRMVVAPGYGNLHVMIDNPGEVPVELRERFFDKYASSEKIGGTGLGTYSIRLMAEVQGGSVSMDTGSGVTKLTITLPCP